MEEKGVAEEEGKEFDECENNRVGGGAMLFSGKGRGKRGLGVCTLSNHIITQIEKSGKGLFLKEIPSEKEGPCRIVSNHLKG